MLEGFGIPVDGYTRRWVFHSVWVYQRGDWCARCTHHHYRNLVAATEVGNTHPAGTLGMFFRNPMNCIYGFPMYKIE